MSEQITAKQKALEAILLTANTRDDFRLSDEAWTSMVNAAWGGQHLQNRSQLRSQLLDIITSEIPTDGNPS